MMRSRPVQMSTRIVGYAISILALTLIMALGWEQTPANAANAATNKNDYLVEAELSAADQGQLNLARQSLGRVDQEALQLVSLLSEAGPELQSSYDQLSLAVAEAGSSSQLLLIRGVQPSLMRAFEEGNLPRQALVAAADSTQILTDPDEAPAGAIPIHIVRSQIDVEQFQSLLTQFDRALDGLDDETAALAAGRADLTDLADETLKQVAASEVGFSEEAQLELDQRLAENLPDLTNQLNGQMDPDLLCPIPWDPAERLLCAAMDNFVRLNEAYRAEFGTDLPILNGYRTLESQYAVHYDSPNMTAIPGTSNHGLGQAIDFDWDIFDSWDDPEVVWMLENGPDYGFRHPAALGPNTDRPEPWHYEFGTSYSGVDSEDFDGAAPSVIYRVRSPWNP